MHMADRARRAPAPLRDRGVHAEAHHREQHLLRMPPSLSI